MQQESLSSGLKVRHLTMMGLGSAIGAGLFVGSGKSIAAAGPGVLVSYALAGVVVVSVMFLLGELASAKPSSGAFSTYAHEGIGPWAGFAVGWTYWFMLIMVLGVELLAASAIISGWVPLPQWAISLALIAVFACVNLFGVKHFGELEFWFAAIKVGAIVSFLAVGVLALMGVISTPDGAGLARLFTSEGGFFPTGAAGVAAGLLAVMFAFGGIEIITIAAAEASDPHESIRKATISIVGRVLTFYFGSALVMLCILPWNDPSLEQGAFVAVLDALRFPTASGLMEIVIVIALLSAFNAQIYGTSRMAYSLATKGEGHAALLKVSGRGVPVTALLVSVAFSVVAVVCHMIEPHLAGILLDAVGATLLIIWAIIAISQIRLRPTYEAQAILRLRTWWHPWLGRLTVLAILGFAVLMLFDSTSRRNLILAVGIFGFVVAIYFVRQSMSRRVRVDNN